MARYIGPKSKIARKFREPIYGPDKYLKRKIILQGSMVQIKEEENNLNMEFSSGKTKSKIYLWYS